MSAPQSPPEISLVCADSAEWLGPARELLREYARSLNVDLCFQNFEAELAGLPGEYAPYTKQTHKSADGTKSAQMADADTGGAWKEIGSGQGTYTYTFGTKLAGFDPSKTQTIGVWAYRDYAG